MDGSYHIDTALRGFVDRIVKLDEEADELKGARRAIFAEVKEAGFVVSVVRGLVREYRMDADARNALYQQQEEYRVALGMLQGTPLGDYATEAAARTVPMPAKTFAEQPVHDPDRPRGRGRPRKDRTAEALDRARSFLGDDDAAPSKGSRPMFDA